MKVDPMSPRLPILVLCLLLSATSPALAKPLVTPFQQAVAQAASGDEEVAAFYRARSFAPIWMGEGADARRRAFLAALGQAEIHGLPSARYGAGRIREEFREAAEASARGALEVEMTERLLRLVREAGTGILDPQRIDASIKLDVAEFDGNAWLAAFVDAPDRAVQGIWPATPRYVRLLREKLRLEEVAAGDGWGPPIEAEAVVPGSTGPDVLALRDRLVAMGYMPRNLGAAYDAAMEDAVRTFQTRHGLKPDGAAGPATIRAINVPVEDRMAQILVGLERQRWMNKPLEPRHVLVNLAEQRAYVVDDGKVSFETDVVIGADTADRRTPEFSHTMTHMVINPTWNVPRSITVNEYLPALRRGGARHLEVYHDGTRIDPRRVDFSRYTERTFPFRLKQAPGPSNALGRVKFMFPNRWNIYLHDTPSRSLFGRDVRTFSHGCVRVARPLELAYHLLAPQTGTPEADFTRILDTGRERRVDLDAPVGIHLVYWSAWIGPDGRANYRGDPYGRDVLVIDALREAGVATGDKRS